MNEDQIQEEIKKNRLPISFIVIAIALLILLKIWFGISIPVLFI